MHALCNCKICLEETLVASGTRVRFEIKKIYSHIIMLSPLGRKKNRGQRGVKNPAAQ